MRVGITHSELETGLGSARPDQLQLLSRLDVTLQEPGERDNALGQDLELMISSRLGQLERRGRPRER